MSMQGRCVPCAPGTCRAVGPAPARARQRPWPCSTPPAAAACSSASRRSAAAAAADSLGARTGRTHAALAAKQARVVRAVVAVSPLQRGGACACRQALLYWRSSTAVQPHPHTDLLWCGARVLAQQRPFWCRAYGGMFSV